MYTSKDVQGWMSNERKGERDDWSWAAPRNRRPTMESKTSRVP